MDVQKAVSRTNYEVTMGSIFQRETFSCIWSQCVSKINILCGSNQKTEKCVETTTKTKESGNHLLTL